MGLRHLNIQKFRGIKKLEWNITESLCCLFGSGDSGKSTILDAIRLALLPSWTFEFCDSDFHNCDCSTDNLICIEATVGNIPDTLKTEKNFGLYLRGWSTTDGIIDEPDEEHEPVITIRLTVNEFFEPVWRVVTERNPDGVPISAYQRSLVGVLIITPNSTDSFSWGKNALLSKATATDQDTLSSLFVTARKSIKENLKLDEVAEFRAIADQLDDDVGEYGVEPDEGYYPRVDLRSIRIHQGTICLHDGDIPVRCFGLGTKKLISLALFKKAFPTHNSIGIDEIETGLEPHRIRQLLFKLKNEDTGRIIITTHSPTVLKELDWNNLFLVKKNDQEITVSQMQKGTRPAIRYIPEAFLAKRVLFCEGKTEIGFLRGLNEYWIESGRPSLWTLGIELVNGEGDDIFKRATAFLKSGYDVCCFLDSDKLEQTQNKIIRLQNAGGVAIHWDGQYSTEEVAIDAVPTNKLHTIWELRAEEKDLDSVKADLSELPDYEFSLNNDVATWCDNNDADNLKRVTKIKAKEKAWFKRVDLAEGLVRKLSPYFNEMEGTDLINKIEALKEWIHDDA